MKSPRITLSDLAIADILEQADWYQSQSDQRLAKRWEKAVTSTLLRIAKIPHSGSPCRLQADELRGTRRSPITGFPNYLIFYQFQHGEILVLRVVHGARDLESLF